MVQAVPFLDKSTKTAANGSSVDCQATCPHVATSHCEASAPCSHGDTPETCSACPTSALTLTEAQQRFRREATEGVFNTGRYRCSYYVWGQGPPLLLVPGMGDHGEIFIILAALLSRQFRCISYAMPAGGADRARLGRYTHADLVADALALLDHLHIQKSYFYGSSFGSTVTLAAMHANPERIPRAILQGGFARRPLARAERLLALFARYWSGYMRDLPLRETVVRHGHHAPFAERPPELWEYYLTHSGGDYIATIARHALLVHGTDLQHLLPSIRQPVLLVCGDCDPLVSKDCEAVLQRGLPRSRRIELAGCGHMPYLTHPEALAEIVRGFLTPPG